MDEKKRILQVIDRVEVELKEFVQNEIETKASRANHSSPILKKMAMFRNEKIGEKFSIKDLLR